MKVLFVIAALFVAQTAAQTLNSTVCTTFCAMLDSVCGTSGSGGIQANGWGTNITTCTFICSQIGTYTNIDISGYGYPFYYGYGTNGTTGEDSLGCRYTYLQMAAAQPANASYYCPLASFLSAEYTYDYCTTGLERCLDHCIFVAGSSQTICAPTYYLAGAPAPEAESIAVSGCLENCYYYPDVSYNSTAAPTGGNSLQCRQYHASVAITSNSFNGNAFHCAHASPSGGGVCGNSTDAIVQFCNVVNNTCGIFSDCKANATLFSQALLGSEFGAGLYTAANTSVLTNYTAGVNDLGCRMFYASLSAYDSTTYCPMTSTSSPACSMAAPAPTPSGSGTGTGSGTGSHTGSAATVIASVALVAAALLAAF